MSWMWRLIHVFLYAVIVRDGPAGQEVDNSDAALRGVNQCFLNIEVD